MESGEFKCWVNGEEVTFIVCKYMKQPSDLHMISVIDLIDEEVSSVGEVSCVGECLAAVLLNYDGKEIHDYDDVVVALSGLGSYFKNPLKLDIDLKNREIPPAKTSIEEPPKLELKVLHLTFIMLSMKVITFFP